MPKKVCKGESKGKTVARGLKMENVSEQQLVEPSTSGIKRWGEDDTFRSVMHTYHLYSRKRYLSPRKIRRVSHAQFCHDDESDESAIELEMPCDEKSQSGEDIVCGNSQDDDRCGSDRGPETKEHDDDKEIKLETMELSDVDECEKVKCGDDWRGSDRNREAKECDDVKEIKLETVELSDVDEREKVKRGDDWHGSDRDREAKECDDDKEIKLETMELSDVDESEKVKLCDDWRCSDRDHETKECVDDKEIKLETTELIEVNEHEKVKRGDTQQGTLEGGEITEGTEISGDIEGTVLGGDNEGTVVGNNERTVEGGDVEGDTAPRQRGRGGAKRKIVRPSLRPVVQRPQCTRARVVYYEQDDDSDQYANESADNDVSSEYQLSDLDEEHDLSGFEEYGGLFSAEEALSQDEDSDVEGGRGRAREQGRAGSRRLRRVSGARRKVRKRRRVVHANSDSRLRSPNSGDDVDEKWSEDPTPPHLHPFTATPGMTVPIPTTPLGFFQLFISHELLVFLMEETNDFAHHQRVEMAKPSAYKWSETNVIDIAKYLGIVMWMGIIGLPEMRMYWARNKTYSMSAFPEAMARRRFEAIGKYFCTFNRRAVPKGNTDKLIIIRPVMNYILNKCRTLYVPRKDLSINEGMLKWKGHLSMRVYDPQKPIKYGVKFYFLCESKTGYVLNFIIYRGVASTMRDIVFNLLDRHLQKGHHIFMDNYYNSVDLAEELYQNGTHVSGTLQLVQGAPEYLKNLAQNCSLAPGEMAFRKKANTFVLCWQDVRLVTFITTGYDVSTEEFVHRRQVKRGDKLIGEETTMQRPKIVKQYANYMEGVDRFHQLINYHAIARRTYSWTKKTIFYLLHVGLLNAYFLYRQFSKDRMKMPLKAFQEEIADCLLYYDKNEWTDSGYRIPHAQSLPVDIRYDGPPIVAPASPSAMPSDPSAMPGPSSARPAGPAATPATSSSEEESTDNPGTPRSGCPYKRNIVDHPDRLMPGPNHVQERIGHKRQQKRCRVCYMNGKRRDTSFQCTHCKIALCVRRDCFRCYHTQQKYWSTPVAGGRVAVRGRRWR